MFFTVMRITYNLRTHRQNVEEEKHNFELIFLYLQFSLGHHSFWTHFEFIMFMRNKSGNT